MIPGIKVRVCKVCIGPADSGRSAIPEGRSSRKEETGRFHPVYRMVFRKTIEAACTYCRFARKGEDDTLICPYRGVMQPWNNCSRFRYDPGMRVPEAAPEASTTADPDDFDF